jgi:hypothetical protein
LAGRAVVVPATTTARHRPAKLLRQASSPIGPVKLCVRVSPHAPAPPTRPAQAQPLKAPSGVRPRPRKPPQPEFGAGSGRYQQTKTHVWRTLARAERYPPRRNNADGHRHLQPIGHSKLRSKSSGRWLIWLAIAGTSHPRPCLAGPPGCAALPEQARAGVGQLHRQVIARRSPVRASNTRLSSWQSSLIGA